MQQLRALLNTLFGIIYVMTEAIPAKRVYYRNTVLLLMVDAAQVDARAASRSVARSNTSNLVHLNGVRGTSSHRCCEWSCSLFMDGTRRHTTWSSFATLCTFSR